MRRSYVLLVVAAILFICCEGVFAVGVGEANRLAIHNKEQLLAIRSADQPTSSNKRLLRKHTVSDEYTKDGEEKFDKEERVSPKLDRIFSDKFLSKAATATTSKLTRSKSLPNLSKVDDIQAFDNVQIINRGMFQQIERMGFNPDQMYRKLKTDNLLGDESNVYLWIHYLRYWKDKYPNWRSHFDIKGAHS
ncbi:putative RxLR effector [Phytophthora palmivora]|uniref:RxLR effector protein n=1 Tax=Phytophthora palmivora TaxID=4796 RepID=A0A2P4XA43_9STRA|nr:putative RxLR effector [Phytophthora palmivora]